MFGGVDTFPAAKQVSYWLQRPWGLPQQMLLSLKKEVEGGGISCFNLKARARGGISRGFLVAQSPDYHN